MFAGKCDTTNTRVAKVKLKLFASYTCFRCHFNSKTSIFTNLEVLLLDVCQGYVVDEHNAGHVDVHAEVLQQSLHFLDPSHVATVTQGLNQSGERKLRGHPVFRQHGPQFLKSICGTMQGVSMCVTERSVCMCVCMFTHAVHVMFLTLSQASLAQCDDEQAGGGIT